MDGQWTREMGKGTAQKRKAWSFHAERQIPNFGMYVQDSNVERPPVPQPQNFGTAQSRLRDFTALIWPPLKVSEISELAAQILILNQIGLSLSLLSLLES